MALNLSRAPQAAALHADNASHAKHETLLKSHVTCTFGLEASSQHRVSLPEGKPKHGRPPASSHLPAEPAALFQQAQPHLPAPVQPLTHKQPVAP